ncbi:MAG: hypothetical protein ACKPA9_17155, partial [Microcystis sp.]
EKSFGKEAETQIVRFGNRRPFYGGEDVNLKRADKKARYSRPCATSLTYNIIDRSLYPFHLCSSFP